MKSTDPEKKRRNQALRLARAHYAYSAVLAGLNHLEAMDKLCRKEDGLEWQAHWISFVVSHSRPFVHAECLGLEDDKIVPQEYRDLHTEVVKRHRNAAVAHTDPNEHELNSAIFRIRDGSLVLEPEFYHPDSDKVQACREMGEAVLGAIAEAIKKRLECFPELVGLQNGTYNFDMNVCAGTEWKPTYLNPGEQNEPS
jgi:hypothetical protein